MTILTTFFDKYLCDFTQCTVPMALPYKYNEKYITFTGVLCNSERKTLIYRLQTKLWLCLNDQHIL